MPMNEDGSPKNITFENYNGPPTSFMRILNVILKGSTPVLQMKVKALQINIKNTNHQVTLILSSVLTMIFINLG